MNKVIKVKKILEAIHQKLDLKNFLNELNTDEDFLKDINNNINKNKIFKKRNFQSILEFSVYRNFIYSLIT